MELSRPWEVSGSNLCRSMGYLTFYSCEFADNISEFITIFFAVPSSFNLTKSPHTFWSEREKHNSRANFFFAQPLITAGQEAFFVLSANTVENWVILKCRMLNLYDVGEKYLCMMHLLEYVSKRTGTF